MATLRIINSKSERVADALTAQLFVDFKKRCGEEGFGRVKRQEHNARSEQGGMAPKHFDRITRRSRVH